MTVPNDLVVAAGASCSLNGTTVQGNVQVRKGATLIANNGTLEDKVRVAKNGYLDTTDTTIGKQVTLRTAFGAFLDGTQVGAGETHAARTPILTASSICSDRRWVAGCMPTSPARW